MTVQLAAHNRVKIRYRQIKADPAVSLVQDQIKPCLTDLPGRCAAQFGIEVKQAKPGDNVGLCGQNSFFESAERLLGRDKDLAILKGDFRSHSLVIQRSLFELVHLENDVDFIVRWVRDNV